MGSPVLCRLYPQAPSSPAASHVHLITLGTFKFTGKFKLESTVGPPSQSQASGSSCAGPGSWKPPVDRLDSESDRDPRAPGPRALQIVLVGYLQQWPGCAHGAPGQLEDFESMDLSSSLHWLNLFRLYMHVYTTIMIHVQPL